MNFSEVASRYATALYSLAEENKSLEKTFSDLRGLRDLFSKNAEINEFIESPVIKASTKEEILKKTLEGKGLSAEVESFVYLLAAKGRLSLFDQIVEAFQSHSDAAHGVTRGEVASASVLTPEEQKQLEQIVAKVTNKQVILTYKEDPQLIGGLTAQVGSYRFDDSLQGHLRRLNEELNRRTH